MAYEAKTKENTTNVRSFIQKIEKDQKREEALKLLELFEETTGYSAKMWGSSIIGFGRYDYVYASGHSGSAPLTGFAPGKGHKISLYVLIPYSDIHQEYLDRIGKHTHGKSCLYINKLADIDQEVLKEMIQTNIKYMKEKYPDTK
ncbi:DUF1801 domain-containing protein [Facklamia miroungae]|uniref:YdhG-like domain-containing protein n=1 Tax=Facklamia miroungae TaxID=120956 RepID=A0A1G7PEB5_9LACT|nr:DUF1801 domain-containing protein [Facklamia miroungae]NKZ28680.1 DUF1801 domain-containing protein [Facklamia miroungae]SDF84568.1 protein of unknown function (DU1801) [Facklamia miroungae]